MVRLGKRYRSFISYSQKDRAWGRRIHTWLETYRVPVGVMVDVQPGRRLGRFFRDDDEMPAAADIGEVVREAIHAAESLIVICSPRSAQSKWVSAEIQNYREAHPGGKVFAVIVDGTPNSDDPATECFPPAMRAARDPNDPDSLPIEPLGLDVRKEGKARTCARLAAGLLDIDFDDLWQRDRRRAEAQSRAVIMGLGAAVLVFGLLAAAATWFAFEAQRQREVALARTRDAVAARQTLQREYLVMLGETAIGEVLTGEADPGDLEMNDPTAWISLMQRDGRSFAIARDHGEGRVMAVAHDGVLNGARSRRGDGFLNRTIAWLRGPQGPQVVVISSGHCEWLPNDAPDWRLPALLREWGYEVRFEEERIDDSALEGAGVLIIGNAWGNFSPQETAAIERFVARGRGLFTAGLAWSWAAYAGQDDFTCTGQNEGQNVADLSTYPMNRMLAPFGARWTDNQIER